MRNEFIRRNQSQTTISKSQHDLIDEIYECLDSYDEDALEILIDKVLKNPTMLLPRSTLCEILEFSSNTGSTELFHKLLAYIKTFEAEFHAFNVCYFEKLNLELDWRTGKNVDQLIGNFETLYKKHLNDKVGSRHMSKFASVMIQDCIEKKCEAVVLKLKDKIEKMCDESDDYQLLFELWRNLFER